MSLKVFLQKPLETNHFKGFKSKILQKEILLIICLPNSFRKNIFSEVINLRLLYYTKRSWSSYLDVRFTSYSRGIIQFPEENVPMSGKHTLYLLLITHFKYQNHYLIWIPRIFTHSTASIIFMKKVFVTGEMI